MMDWQEPAAVVIVAITLAVFLFRLARQGPKSGCGGRCGCRMKNRKPDE
jgi:hypothetical protein